MARTDYIDTITLGPKQTVEFWGVYNTTCGDTNYTDGELGIEDNPQYLTVDRGSTNLSLKFTNNSSYEYHSGTYYNGIGGEILYQDNMTSYCTINNNVRLHNLQLDIILNPYTWKWTRESVNVNGWDPTDTDNNSIYYSETTDLLADVTNHAVISNIDEYDLSACDEDDNNLNDLFVINRANTVGNPIYLKNNGNKNSITPITSGKNCTVKISGKNINNLPVKTCVFHVAKAFNINSTITSIDTYIENGESCIKTIVFTLCPDKSYVNPKIADNYLIKNGSEQFNTVRSGTPVYNSSNEYTFTSSDIASFTPMLYINGNNEGISGYDKKVLLDRTKGVISIILNGIDAPVSNNDKLTIYSSTTISCRTYIFNNGTVSDCYRLIDQEMIPYTVSIKHYIYVYGFSPTLIGIGFLRGPQDWCLYKDTGKTDGDARIYELETSEWKLSNRTSTWAVCGGGSGNASDNKFINVSGTTFSYEYNSTSLPASNAPICITIFHYGASNGYVNHSGMNFGDDTRYSINTNSYDKNDTFSTGDIKIEDIKSISCSSNITYYSIPRLYACGKDVFGSNYDGLHSTGQAYLLFITDDNKYILTTWGGDNTGIHEASVISYTESNVPNVIKTKCSTITALETKYTVQGTAKGFWRKTWSYIYYCTSDNNYALTDITSIRWVQNITSSTYNDYVPGKYWQVTSDENIYVGKSN